MDRRSRSTGRSSWGIRARDRFVLHQTCGHTSTGVNRRDCTDRQQDSPLETTTSRAAELSIPIPGHRGSPQTPRHASGPGQAAAARPDWEWQSQRPLRAARDDLFAIFDGKGGALSRSQPANLRTNSAQLGFLTTSSAAQWRLATRPGRRERGVCSRWLPSYANTACGTRCSECVSDPAGAWPWFWKPPTGRVAGVSGPCLRHGGSTQHRREHGRLTDVGGLACGEQSQVSVLR